MAYHRKLPACLLCPLLLVLGSLAGILLVGCRGQAMPGAVSGGPRGTDKYVQGVLAYQSGQKDQAVQSFLAAVQENPDLRMAHAMLGDIFRSDGKYLRALPHDQAVARLDPYTVSAHYNLGITYHFLNRLRDAAASYLKALNLRPGDYRSNMNLGLAYLALGDRQEALKHLEQATSISPNSAQAWSNLGVALDAAGETQRAEQAYRKSLELNSESLTTLQNLGSNLITQGRAQEAIALLEQVLRKNDSASARSRYGDALALARQYDNAARQYDLAMQRDPRFYPALNAKANLLLRQYREGLELDESKKAAAIEAIRQSLKLQPNQPKLKEELARLEKPSLFGG